jgi:hypothetical protein
MTAESTALRIVRWAAGDMSQMLPEGDLAEAVGLAEPDPATLLWIGRLAAITAARLRLDPPPLGDAGPPGRLALVLAAAIGARNSGDRAGTLLQAVRRPQRPADLLAHHGLVAPAAARLPALADRLRDLSPLTGVLTRPGPATASACESLLERLRADPSARAMLIRVFATPPESAPETLWRGESLTFLRHEDPGFVLDVYRAALRHHRREHEIRARAAWRHVLAGEGWRDAAPTAYWWRALAELEAAMPARVRGLEGRRAGTNLYRRMQREEQA